MERLPQELKASLNNFLRELRRKRACSWLTVALEEYFGRSDLIRDVEDAVKVVAQILHGKRWRKLILLPEPGWEIPKAWGITGPRLLLVIDP